jgi:hypothetical protein
MVCHVQATSRKRETAIHSESLTSPRPNCHSSATSNPSKFETQLKGEKAAERQAQRGTFSITPIMISNAMSERLGTLFLDRTAHPRFLRSDSNIEERHLVPEQTVLQWNSRWCLFKEPPVQTWPLRDSGHSSDVNQVILSNTPSSIKYQASSAIDQSP